MAQQFTPNFKVCPACGQRLALTMTACGRCKAIQPTQQAPAVPIPVQPVYSAVPLIVPCPVCHHEDVQKVSAIVQSGSWSSSSQSIGVGGGHVFGGPDFATVTSTSTKGQGASILAQALAPPPAPRTQSTMVGCLGLGCLLPLGGFCLLAFLGSLTTPPGATNASGSSAVSLVMGVLFAGGGLALFWHSSQESKRLAALNEIDRTRWQQAMQVWNTLLYCQRCDSVYIPHTGRAAPSAQMRQLL